MMCKLGHGKVSNECPKCISEDTAQLRRDLATRDRELAEERAAGLGACAQLDKAFAERDLARAALAEKEREVADWKGRLETACNDIGALRVDLVAAQEEAKGLRKALTALEQTTRGSFGAFAQDVHRICERALAARQQQPDACPACHGDSAPLGTPGKAWCSACQPEGKPDPAPVASETECTCADDFGPMAPHRSPCQLARPRKDG